MLTPISKIKIVVKNYKQGKKESSEAYNERLSEILNKAIHEDNPKVYTYAMYVTSDSDGILNTVICYHVLEPVKQVDPKLN